MFYGGDPDKQRRVDDTPLATLLRYVLRVTMLRICHVLGFARSLGA